MRITRHRLTTAWKVLWLIPIFAGLWITSLFVYIGWGPNRAKRFYDDARGFEE